MIGATFHAVMQAVHGPLHWKLNSTISTLKNTHGLNINRQWEKVSNRWGASCHVIRYRLLDPDKEQADRVLDQLPGRTPPSKL